MRDARIRRDRIVDPQDPLARLREFRHARRTGERSSLDTWPTWRPSDRAKRHLLVWWHEPWPEGKKQRIQTACGLERLAWRATTILSDSIPFTMATQSNDCFRCIQTMAMRYLMGRVCSPPETCWIAFRTLSERYPPLVYVDGSGKLAMRADALRPQDGRHPTTAFPPLDLKSFDPKDPAVHAIGGPPHFYMEMVEAVEALR